MLVDQSAQSLKVNGTPSVAGVRIDPETAYTTDDLVATAEGPSDPEGHRVSLRWQWYEDGDRIQGATDAVLAAVHTEKDHTYRVVVVPSDGFSEGIAGETSRRVDNSPPDILDPWLTPSVARVGTTLECGARVVDPDGDPAGLDVRWSDGSTGSTATIPYTAVPGDVFACTLTASDSAGGVSVRILEATVENTPPDVTVQVIPEEAAVGEAVVCEATATDLDGETPALAYAWSNGVEGSALVVSSEDEPGLPVTCTATATDGSGATAVGTADLMVVNTAPVLSEVVISPDPPTNDAVLSCSASATDVDGGTPVLVYAWEYVESGQALGASSSLDLQRTYVRPGDHVRCTVTAEDAHGGSVVAWADVSPTNREPTVTASFMPASDVTVEDTLVCTSTQVDPDRDPLTTTFSWTVDSEPVTASRTAGVTSELSGAFVKHQVVLCSAMVDDGLGGVASDTVMTDIVNSPPVLTAVSMRPTPLETDDLVQATALVSDADGEHIDMNFDWSVNGTGVQSGTNEYLDGNSWFVRGDTVAVTISASDDEVTVTGSASFVVANAKPTAPSVAVYPRSPHPGDTLLCVVEGESEDADGDFVNYTMDWTVDGRNYATGGTWDTGGLDSGELGWAGPTTSSWTGDTVSSEDVEAGQTWNCTVTPDDGIDIGVPVASNVSVSSSTP